MGNRRCRNRRRPAYPDRCCCRCPWADPMLMNDWEVGEVPLIRHLPPELFNPFIVNPARCYEEVEELRRFCAEHPGENPFMCSEEALEALLIACLTPYR
ncbi:MAG: hypothetical protein ACM3XM_19560 [Mycobacterium leprae]